MPTRRRADSSRPFSLTRAEEPAHPARKKPTRRRAKNAQGVTFRRSARIGRRGVTQVGVDEPATACVAEAVGTDSREAGLRTAGAPMSNDTAASQAATPQGDGALPVAGRGAIAQDDATAVTDAAPGGAAMRAAAGIAEDGGPASAQAPDPSAGADADATPRGKRLHSPRAVGRALRRGLAQADRADKSLAERARDLLLGPARTLASTRRGGATTTEGFYVPAHQAHTPAASALVAPHAPGTRLTWAFAIGLAGLLCMAAVIAFTWIAPVRSAEAQQYFAADLKPDVSTPRGGWTRGVVPAIYQGDERWGSAPYGVTTIGESGAAPCALCMVYVEETGDRSRTPLDFAGWAETARVASPARDDVIALLTDGAADAGLVAQALEPDALGLRQALGNGQPVVCVTRAGTFDEHTSCVVLTGINEHSLLVLVDPASSERSAESWTFDEVLGASDALYSYTSA